MPKLIRTFTISLALLACVTPGASAQNPAADADVNEVRAYRLTMDAVNRWEKVIRYLDEWVKTDPQSQAQIKLQGEVEALRKKDELTEAEQARLEKLEKQLEAMEDADDLGDDPTITQMIAEVNKFKPAVEALRRAGMTPREYIVFSLALLEASLHVGIKKAGLGADLPKDVNPANIKFVEEHYAEIEALQKEMERIGKAIPASAKKGS